mmetsp:Transcript_53890/g.136857  ORF Transcript_53890/g.136857 Transcript_53890/m.136857 type:complete len:216 (+) Transcript_53890:435-1082(+)
MPQQPLPPKGAAPKPLAPQPLQESLPKPPFAKPLPPSLPFAPPPLPCAARVAANFALAAAAAPGGAAPVCTTSSAPRPESSSQMWNSTGAPTSSSIAPSISFMPTKRLPLCNFAFSCSISSPGVIHPYFPFQAATVPVNFSADSRVRGKVWPLPPSLELLLLPLPLPLPPPLSLSDQITSSSVMSNLVSLLPLENSAEPRPRPLDFPPSRRQAPS